ncbi:MAG: nucleotidyltransferase domain-containing protein [Candidatus ainarchaeum sp.]|nr:nucleotidyltransferase domain-containing protein [Candidatus ainarchaeum sp.]
MGGEKGRFLKPFVKKLRARYPGARVILFGSRARGDVNEKSDYDLIVIAGFAKRFFDRVTDVSELAPAGARVDVLPYTPAEFEQVKGRAFFREVLKESVELT